MTVFIITMMMVDDIVVEMSLHLSIIYLCIYQFHVSIHPSINVDIYPIYLLYPLLLLLYIGADSMMFTRVSTADTELLQQTQKDIDQFSTEGLRCLVLAAVEIESSKFMEWKIKYDRASTDLKELEKRKVGEPNQIEVHRYYATIIIIILNVTIIFINLSS